jgi:hypothetical protein
MWRRLRLGDGDHNNDGNDNDGNGDDPQRRSSQGPTPLLSSSPSSSPSSSRSSVRDLIRLALGRMPFFPGIGAASPTTRAIILIMLSYIALLPSHEVESSLSLIEAEATIRWRSSSDEGYRQSLPPVAKHVEGGRPLVVQYVAVQFVDQAHPANDAAGTCPPGSAVIVPCDVITTSDSIWENGPHFTTTDIKTILPPLTPTPHCCRPRWAPSSPSPPARLSPSPTPARSRTPRWPRPNLPGRGITREATGQSAPPAPRGCSCSEGDRPR